MNTCENLELLLALLLAISEALPFIKDKQSCNGIINTVWCMLKKGKCKEVPASPTPTLTPPEVENPAEVV